ncbi:ATP-binding protein [Rhizobium laguerreae]
MSGKPKTFLAAPIAATLIESMRDIGYSIDTALADIIDNSLASGASEIDLLADTSSDDPKIAILDNGQGMTFEELVAAMRPGSRNPLEERTGRDLGRFGLGLKTASFSQCRRLTVITVRKGVRSAAIWDLDFVAERNKWLVQIPDPLERHPWAEQLGNQGTLVIWESLDRLAPKGERGDLVRALDLAREHLELVFHRFLTGERGWPRVRMRLNNRDLQPFDPFNQGNPATIIGPMEEFRSGVHTVTIQCFTLPHHKKLLVDEWERNGGRAGYLKNQGFYVYRARRLIIHGTWFGLVRQTELTKLARVKIDIPTGLDAEWKIDVKKASAQPPFKVRERLRRIIDTIGATSKRVYTARGRKLISDARLPVWNRHQDKNEISYRLNPEHPLLVHFLAGLSDEQKVEFDRLALLIEASIPMESLYADMGAEPENIKSTDIPEDTLREIAHFTAENLISSGTSLDEVRLMMQVTEPFRSNWAVTEGILDERYGGSKDE